MSRARPRFPVGPLLAALLAGCAVGPDYVAPSAPAATRYRPAATQAAPSGAEAGIGTQQLQPDAEVPAQWWRAFGSATLDALVTGALAGSPTLEAARARVAQADEAVRAARGPLFPQVGLQASAGRGDSAAARGGGALTVYSIGPTVSYAPDLFGGTARRVEQARAQADFQFAQQAAAELALSGNTALQAIALAGARAQIAAAEDIVALDERNVELVRLSTEGGKSARLDLLTAQSQLANDRALLPPLRQQASVAVHALAVLRGRATADAPPPKLELADLKLPGALPLALPSRLVQRRPDIAAAEAQLRAANAAIGIATAQLYPNLTLTATWSSVAATPGSLFSSGTSVWNLAADLLAPVFSGFTLQAQRDAAVQAYAAQLGDYRQAVLQAFGQVADLLDALEQDAALVAQAQQALATANQVMDLTQQSYQAGQASLLQLLVAQRQYQQARLVDVRARVQQLADSAQLFVAMGGAVPLARPQAGETSGR